MASTARIQGTPAFTARGNARYKTFRESQQIAQPANLFVLLDECSVSINDSYFGIEMSNTGTRDGRGAANPYWVIDYPDSYHSGLIQIAFADGHAEAHRWLEATTLVGIERARSGTHTSRSDRDVLWLQEHCTVLKWPRSHPR